MCEMRSKYTRLLFKSNAFSSVMNHYHYITKYLGNNMLHHDALKNVFIIDDPFPGSCYVYESLRWIKQPLVLSQHRTLSSQSKEKGQPV